MSINMMMQTQLKNRDYFKLVKKSHTIRKENYSMITAFLLNLVKKNHISQNVIVIESLLRNFILDFFSLFQAIIIFFTRN